MYPPNVAMLAAYVYAAQASSVSGSATEVKGIIERLTTDSAVITVVFLLVGVYVLKLWLQYGNKGGNNESVATISATLAAMNSTVKDASLQSVSALVASTSAITEFRSLLSSEVHEHQEVRRHLHRMVNYLIALQPLILAVIEHLERHEGDGAKFATERELLHAAMDELRGESGKAKVSKKGRPDVD